MVSMNLLNNALVILSLVIILSQSSQWTNQNFELTENENSRCNSDNSCPTWFTCNSQNSCQCGHGHNYAVICDRKLGESAVLDCHCVTYDRNSEWTYLGMCFYNCENINPGKQRDYIYTVLPQKPAELLNKSACTHFHRTGLLCGDCEEGHSPLVFSYSLNCVKCPDGHKNWWKFILAGFVPLTFFFFHCGHL